MSKNKTEYNFTYKDSWKNFPPEELLKIQQVLSQKMSLTIPEAAIWLGVSPNHVSKLIQKGILSAYHAFGSRSVRIDVEQSKKLLKSLRESENSVSKVYQGGM